MIDRLRLDEGRVRSMAEGARQVAQLPDPTGNVLETIHRPNGMVIEKVSVPMGVIGIIYEARPNVTVDSAVLCFKAGSAAFLRGGKEAFFSNTQLAKVMRSALEQEGLCPDCVILLDDTSRETAQQMMGLPGRRRADPLGGGKRQSAGDRNRYRQLPYLCGQGRRSGYGGGDPL